MKPLLGSRISRERGTVCVAADLIFVEHPSFRGRSQSCFCPGSLWQQGAHKELGAGKGTRAPGKGSWRHELRSSALPPGNSSRVWCNTGEKVPVGGFGCCTRGLRKGVLVSAGCARVSRLSAPAACEPGWSRGDSSSPAAPPLLPSC